MKILPVYYFPPVAWFAAALHEKSFLLEQWEFYRKQQLFNRTRILGANGVLKLSIPIRKSKEYTPLCKREISHDWKWTREQWMSVTSAYRSSPYFEFYEDQLEPLFTEKPVSLLDHNLRIIQTISDALQLDLKWHLSDSYREADAYEKDYRSDFNAQQGSSPGWFQPEPYPHVFSDKFIPDLSILDLLCNQGPGSIEILRKSYKD